MGRLGASVPVASGQLPTSFPSAAEEVNPTGSPEPQPPSAWLDDLSLFSDYVAIFGEAQFITPNDTGAVTATFGIAFYPGGGARRAGTNAFAPLMPLGNNPSFAVDLR